MPNEFHNCRHGIVMATTETRVIDAAAQSTRESESQTGSETESERIAI